VQQNCIGLPTITAGGTIAVLINGTSNDASVHLAFPLTRWKAVVQLFV
jgi:hypothetical protein